VSSLLIRAGVGGLFDQWDDCLINRTDKQKKIIDRPANSRRPTNLYTCSLRQLLYDRVNTHQTFIGQVNRYVLKGVCHLSDLSDVYPINMTSIYAYDLVVKRGFQMYTTSDRGTLVGVAVSELAKRLEREVRESSYREMAEKTKLSHGALEHLVKSRNEEFPKLETLDKLATYWQLPLWRVIEMAGVDLGLPRSIDETVQQLTSLAKRLPEIEPIVQYLLKLYPEDLRGVVAYLEALDRQHSRNRGWSGEDVGPRQ
jgi:transcriptional regulator with XRE-family HTH domain